MNQQTPTVKTLVILSLAMHMSILMIVFVCFLCASQSNWDMGFNIQPENDLLFKILSGVAVVNATLAMNFPKILRDKNADPTVVEGVILDFSQFSPRLMQLTIIRMALSESIVLFGFVQAFINHSFGVILPYALIGLTLQFLLGPIFGLSRSIKNQ